MDVGSDAASVAKALTPALPTQMSFDITPGSAYASMVAAGFNFAALWLKVFASPEMLAMHQNEAIQAMLSDDAKMLLQAHITGNLANVNAESNG
jgi:hypothetical protein